MTESKNWRLTAAGVVAVLIGHLAVSHVLQAFGLKTLTALGIGEIISLALLALLIGRHWRQIFKVSTKHLGHGILMLWPAAFILLINILVGLQTPASIGQ